MDKASFSSAPEPFTVYCYLVSPASVYSGRTRVRLRHICLKPFHYLPSSGFELHEYSGSIGRTLYYIYNDVCNSRKSKSANTMMLKP